jgi:dolichol-phosphate mannosyltransferase
MRALEPASNHDRAQVTPELGVVIPCFNEEAVLPSLFAALDAFAAKWGGPVWFLLVDDGSRDATARLLREQAARDPRFGSLHFSRNFGHQVAVSAGLAHVRGDVVAVLDADLQDPPEVILEMLAAWRQGYDVIYGVRRNRKEGLLLRACYAAFYRLMRKVANADIPLDAGDFSLMDRRVVDVLNSMPEHNRFVRGLRGWVGFRQFGLPYDRAARAAGEAKYGFRKLLRLALDGLVSFSSLPLRLAAWLGLFAAGVGFLLMAWALFAAIVLERTPPGWASTAVIVLFFGGVQLLMLGVLGEYLGRIFEEVKGRPHWVIASESGWLAKDRRRADSRPSTGGDEAKPTTPF